jgi:citrate lyase beta subunit
MIGWRSRVLAAAGFAAALLLVTAPAQAEKRVALVIGNNDYRNVPKLQKAVNDARTMGDTLKQLGFSVMGRGEPEPAGVFRDAAGVRQGRRAGRHRALLLCRARL